MNEDALAAIMLMAEAHDKVDLGINEGEASGNTSKFIKHSSQVQRAVVASDMGWAHPWLIAWYNGLQENQVVLELPGTVELGLMEKREFMGLTQYKPSRSTDRNQDILDNLHYWMTSAALEAVTGLTAAEVNDGLKHLFGEGKVSSYHFPDLYDITYMRAK